MRILAVPFQFILSIQKLLVITMSKDKRDLPSDLSASNDEQKDQDENSDSESQYQETDNADLNKINPGDAIDYLPGDLPGPGKHLSFTD